MKTQLLLSLLAFLPQSTETMALSTVDGDTLTAQVLELKGDTAKLKLSIFGGTATVNRKLADFTPASVFRIEMAANPPKDFDSHFAMAKRAADLRQLGSAGAQCRAAIESVKDPAAQEGKKKEVRTWAALALEKMIHDCVTEKRLADAKHALKLLSTRLSDQRTEEQLDAIAGAVATLEQGIATERETARMAKLDAQARDKVTKALTKVREQLAKGDKIQREAVAKSSSTVASANLCEKAIEAYKAGWKILQEVIEKGGDDMPLAKEAASLTQTLHDQAIRAGLHAANMLTVQSNYKGALDWTGRILAFDPDNAEAKEMMRTIQVAAAAASSQWGWGWSATGGGGGQVPQPKR